MDHEISIYKKIFDLADANMKKQGGAFSYSRAAFLTLIQAEPNIVNVNEFDELGMEDCLTAVYLRCLNRLPDESIYQSVINMKNESEISRKYLILCNVIHSVEFAESNKTVQGMKELKRKWKQERSYSLRQLLHLQIQAIKSKCFGNVIVPVWVRLPNCVKNMVRKLAGRESKPE